MGHGNANAMMNDNDNVLNGCDTQMEFARVQVCANVYLICICSNTDVYIIFTGIREPELQYSYQCEQPNILQIIA